ncbi:hypothetical protein DSECCO2_443310 [anaerobic digester metagenome]
MDILEFLIIASSLLMIPPIAVSIWKNIPFLDAVNLTIEKTTKFWRMLNDTPMPIQYNVNIGDDYFYITDRFKELENFFYSYHFNGITNYPNFLVYHFDVSIPKKDMDSLQLLTIIEKISEKILADHFNLFGVTIPVKPLTSVFYKNSKLGIAFAYNDEGIQAMTNARNKMRKYHGSPIENEKSNESIDINWDEEEIIEEDEKDVKENEEAVNKDEDI